MEKDFCEEDSMNSTGISSEDDICMDYEIETANYGPPRKRRMLVERFDALTLEDGSELLK